MVVHIVVGALLGSALLVASALKLLDPTGTAVAAQAYGVGGRLATSLAVPLALGEAAIAAGVLAAWAPALWSAAALLGAFAVVQTTAISAGRAGEPCGCFGGHGRLSGASVARTSALAAVAAALALTTEPAATGARAAAAFAAIAFAATLAWRARRERDGRPALELADEGPALGSRLALDLPGGDIRLAVFTSRGCSLCRRLREPAARMGAVVFDEHEDAATWTAANVPGAPYVVAVSAGGRVLAKGTVNSARQIESVVAAARERSAPPAVIDPLESAPTSRRSFLATAGTAVAAIAGARTVGALVEPGDANAFHFCGHIYTTDGCPHPTGLPRIDSRGYPLRAGDGKPVDDLGRPIDGNGAPLDARGRPLLDPDGRPLPPATRTKVCTAAGRRYRIPTRIDGAWYRCCDGRVRKLMDCCSTSSRRINGDRALKGYCYANRKVFCVMYHQTLVPC